ncbi:hypothetical protein K0M31_007296 [Melipona bicolor]|uniref:Uncharacterized protein n=1 Tax=Melipona bicolor TaxID=60889 RepID=A0AA40GBD6_9HYME|nr:hypothetical protein K0M31_007296 [Melipona bicolor]
MDIEIFVSDLINLLEVLHIINEVLEPVRSNSAEMPIYSPNAFEFLNQSENLDLGVHRVRIFRQRIVTEKKEEVFKADGRYTFLIPVEEGFRVSCLATFPYRSSRKDLNIPCCEPRERIQTVPARSTGPRK